MRASARLSPIAIAKFAAIVSAATLACAVAGADPRWGTDAQIQAIAPKTGAIVVMRDGKIADERYFGDTQPDTLANTRSATKTITALLAGLAIEDGKLKLDTSVWPLLADISDAKDAAHRSVTVEDLLTMSSALDCDDNDAHSPGNEEGMYPNKEWARWAAAIPIDAHYARNAQGRGPWRYCTAGAVLLGHAIARAAGEPLDAFATRRLFAPLGIADAQWSRSPSGEPMPGGGLLLSARDLARIGYVLANGGQWEGRQIVSAAFVRAMETEHGRANPRQGYGYLLWSGDFTTRRTTLSAWYMAGNGGNKVLIAPERKLAITVTRTAYNTKGMHDQTDKLIDEQILPLLLCPAN
jgi:CubicO group peptidase (beta-lactamase class C family)